MTEHIAASATITYAGATAAIAAGLAKAAEIGARMNIAVVDPGGHLVAFARMDGAFIGSAQIAQDKAWTVTHFAGLASDDLYAAIAGEDDVRTGIATRGRVAAFGGGVPIRIDGTLVGAVGASGGSAEQDKAVATAAAGAVG